MILRNPEWLALLPVLLALGWMMPRLNLWRPLRIMCLALITLVLARPQWRLLSDGMDLWVLLDSSTSAEKPMAKGVNELEKLIEKSRGKDDRVFYLNYAGEVMRRGAEGAEIYDRNRSHTRTGLAISQALAFAQREGAGRPARVLAITDGYSTEPLSGVAEKLTKQGVELDYRLMRDAEPTDFRIAAMRIPSRAQLGEPFLVEIEVRGTDDGKVPVIVRRNGRELQTTDADVKMGTGTLRVTDRLTQTGAARYEAIIQPKVDAYPGNNRHEAMIEIAGGPRVLLLTSYKDDPLAATLQKQGFTVETITELRSVRAGQLAGAKCVILNNAPAFELPQEFLASLDFYVRAQGGSVLMAGGKHSFAAGGYFESPIDALLPVSMELKQEHRKLMVAMAIVMDRSGSMGMTVNGGFTKMSLADEGAANAIRFLSPQDLLTVFAVDSEPHEMVPLQQVGPNRDKMESAVRRIESTGGGIYVYTGLRAAWDQLKTAPAGQRHIILFSDAADSEEPGDYKKLVPEIVGGGGTVSVIALGSRSDGDAWLLDDIASLGKGRIFYTDKAEELPSIFSQETVAVARSAFINEPVETQGAGGWFEISGQALDWMPKADGYNLCYLREWASQALLTKDEYNAPLVAFGQRGVGRVAAVTFPLGGEHSQMIRAWSKYGDFVQTLTRWLMGDVVPPGIGLRHRIEGETLTIDLLHDEEWEQRLAKKAPRILLAHGPRAERQHEIAWERMAPGYYQASISLEDGDMVRGAVQAGGQTLAFGPLVSGTSAEWSFDEARVRELRQVSLASGGRELLDLSQAWRNPAVPRFTDLRDWLLALGLVIILFEAFVTRTGWKLPQLVRSPAAAKKKPAREVTTTAADYLARLKRATTTTSSTARPADKFEEDSHPSALLPTPAPDRRSRFDRAKRRGRP
ncbi:MAG: VWA domain-containing protein [Verrucomicrobiaceae bacterium]|nr:VWA domain-containing protein [Verrucomicrobiaceae bacterium]